MIDLSTTLLGPLAAPECARASRRGWVIWVRMLAGLAAGVVAFVVLWFWWIAQQFDPNHQPFQELRIALILIEGMVLAFAMILAPAVLAGSLAGEKERGSIGLLLTTRVSAADIVLGKLAGRLSQVAMIELAGLPCLLLIAAMAGFGWSSTLTLLALPVAISVGGAGIALGASAMSRRGRDALLFVYLLDILFLLAPLLGTSVGPWVGLISPFAPLDDLVYRELCWPALATSGIYLAMGATGLVLAAWRLRPSCLAEGDDKKSKKKTRGFSWIPQIDERPMLWKELYIERVGTLGRAGRWIGGLLVFWLGLGSLGLLGYAAYGHFVAKDATYSDFAIVYSSMWYGNSAIFIGCLIQCAIGLRAAVTISSERERGTWDALLTSPLEGTEIVRGKLWGSLYALKWLIGSALLAWTVTLCLTGMSVYEYVEQLLGLVIIGTFISAVGVRTSLRSATATRAMGGTIGIWLGAFMLFYAVAVVICVLVLFVCLMAWLMSIQIGLTTFSGRPWFPMSWRLGSDIAFYTLYLLGAILIVAETRVRFDRVAGRMTGGETAVALDHLIHGVPMAPVRLEKPKEKAPEPAFDEVAS